MMLGSEPLKRLASARVAVFGVGGVGGHAAEALARSGVGAIDLIDKDTVEETNRNRQAVALCSTIGLLKTEVMKERILDINPECRVTCHNIFYLPENAEQFDLSVYDFILDAIDTVSAKLCLAVFAGQCGVPLIASMGTGNRMDPSKLTVTDISETSGDPLARNVRRELRKRGIDHLPVVFSLEPPVKAVDPLTGEHTFTPGSSAFVPAAAGLLMASYAVRKLSGGAV